MNSLTINKLIYEAHKNSRDKGWWDEDRSPLEVMALIHSEISEAVEDFREGLDTGEGWDMKGRTGKPVGPLIELADVIIRIADYCGKRKWDLESAIRTKVKYNETRSYRHGGKKY